MLRDRKTEKTETGEGRERFGGESEDCGESCRQTGGGKREERETWTLREKEKYES